MESACGRWSHEIFYEAFEKLVPESLFAQCPDKGNIDENDGVLNGFSIIIKEARSFHPHHFESLLAFITKPSIVGGNKSITLRNINWLSKKQASSFPVKLDGKTVISCKTKACFLLKRWKLLPLAWYRFVVSTCRRRRKSYKLSSCLNFLMNLSTIFRTSVTN